jgi:Tfp pilus assembly protein PilF
MLGRLFSELLALGRRDRAREAVLRRFRAALEDAKGLIEARRLDEAERAVASLVESQPASSEARFLAGEIARKRGDLEAAVSAYRDALQRDHGNADAWFALGLARFRAGDLRYAHLYLRTALTFRPQDADILNEVGLVEHAFGNLANARETFERAVNANAEHPQAWSNLGMIHASHGKLRDAKRCFLRAVSVRPSFYMALCNLGLACRQLEQLEEAEAHLRAAIAARPEPPEAWVTLGNLLQDAGRLDEARAACEQAKRRSPGAEARIALAGVHYRLGDLGGAEDEYRAALEREPGHPEAELGLAQLLLSQGRFAEGWDRYEARLRALASPERPFPYPACEGALTGRRVLIYGEQGIGDEILFASCLPDALADARSCFLVPNPRLASLFRRSFPGIEVLRELDAMRVGLEEAPVNAECRLAIGSLPRRYRRSRERFPQRGGYLAADPERAARWRERLAGLGASRVLGIAWRGGHLVTGKTARSLSLEDLACLLRLEGIAWVSLQADATAAELERAERACGVPVRHWPEAHRDLEDTAALICGLEAVVAVASTIVHLAGALGRPVSVLAPAAPSWRYLLEGNTMPWYPSARVFRREPNGGWGEAIGRIAALLRR